MGAFKELANLIGRDDLETALRKIEKRNFHVPPVSFVFTTNGTTSDLITDVQSFNDGNEFVADEEATTPGFDLEFTFSEIEVVRGLATKFYYTGNHADCVVELYNYDTAVWDVIIDIPPNKSDYNYRYVEFPYTRDYTSAGAALVRFNHPLGGNINHDLYIEYLAVIT